MTSIHASADGKEKTMLNTPPDDNIFQALRDLAETVKDGQDGIKYAFISVMGGVVRTMLSVNKRNFGGFVINATTAGFVGYMAALGFQDSEMSSSTVGAIVGVAAFSATDILKGIMRITAAFAEDPHKAIKEILAIWRKK